MPYGKGENINIVELSVGGGTKSAEMKDFQFSIAHYLH
jgi:hypothetical protein